MKTRISFRPTVTVLTTLTAALVLTAALPTLGRAQEITQSVETTDASKTIMGNFVSKDTSGATPTVKHKGTFVEVITVAKPTITRMTTYTDSTSGQVRTVAEVTTENADGTTTHDVTITPFGSTSQFHSNRVVTKIKGGHAGTGTFTATDGTGGTFTTLEGGSDLTTSVSAVYNNTTRGQTHTLDLKDEGFGFITSDTFSTDPTGTTSTERFTRSITSIHK